jgi:hypothetical protein
MKMSARDRAFHRKVGASCFNRAWDLMDKKNRTNADDLVMLHLAHASRYHWSLVGTPTNKAVGDWQLSRIYAALGHPELALAFARSCMQTCKEERLSEIEHTAEEAMARAYATGREFGRARQHLALARRKLDRLSLSKEDREIYLGQLRETETMIEGGIV